MKGGNNYICKDMKTDNQFDISGRVAVMTGACGVLGQTIVKYFAAQGCKVVLLDLERAAQKGWEIVAVIKHETSELTFEPGNLINPSERLDQIHFKNWFAAIRTGSPLNSTTRDYEPGWEL